MTPNHHINEATLVSYSAGALSPEMSAVVATHLWACPHCRAVLADAERIGGVLLSRQQSAEAHSPNHADLRQAMLDRLDDLPVQKSTPYFSADPVAGPENPDDLPRPLQAYFGRSWNDLRWKWAAPGLHMIRSSNAKTDNLVLLKVAAGRSMPVHSHQGTELTQILRGAYDDALGHFGPGDAADLDCDTQHQPIATHGVPCICVAALDAPLHFPGWLARKIQPFVGL